MLGLCILGSRLSTPVSCFLFPGPLPLFLALLSPPLKSLNMCHSNHSSTWQAASYHAPHPPSISRCPFCSLVPTYYFLELCTRYLLVGSLFLSARTQAHHSGSFTLCSKLFQQVSTKHTLKRQKSSGYMPSSICPGP